MKLRQVSSEWRERGRPYQRRRLRCLEDWAGFAVARLSADGCDKADSTAKRRG
jgi:hypothetical protein